MSYTQPVAMDCPECNHEILKPLNWFKLSDSKCPNCDARFTGEKFLKEIMKAQDKLHVIQESMKNISK